MNLFEIREKEIFAILKAIKNQKFVLIGGYAVNAYTLPRFSVDCDIVVDGEKNVEVIIALLVFHGYIKKEADNANSPLAGIPIAASCEVLPARNAASSQDYEIWSQQAAGYCTQFRNKTARWYYGAFFRYEKELAHNFKVSMDILLNAVLDRRTNAIFSAQWVVENSSLRLLRGKTIIEEVMLNIITPDALIAMKCVSCRNTDIRDIFMLIVHAQNMEWIRDEVKKRTDFKNKAKEILTKVSSSAFKNNLQGVYGFFDNKIFEKHKKLIFSFCG